MAKTQEQLEAAFATFGDEVAAVDVPALVLRGDVVWSFQYGHEDDDEFTTIEVDDLEPMEDWSNGVNDAFWGPFRVEPR